MDAAQLYAQVQRLTHENHALRAKIGTKERQLEAAHRELAKATEERDTYVEALHQLKDRLSVLQWTDYLKAHAKQEGTSAH